MSENNKLLGIVMICVTIVGLAGIASSTMFSLNDRKLMADNIDKAIEKGVDPMTVRCSYADSKDLICIAFAAAGTTHPGLVKK